MLTASALEVQKKAGKDLWRMWELKRGLEPGRLVSYLKGSQGMLTD